MSKRQSPKPTWKREFLQFFGSLQLAIVLLLLIAAASSIGTFLPQDQGPGLIHNSTFPAPAKAVLLALQAYDVYHSLWFNVLLAVLFINLAVCTYLRFPPTWRRYQMKLPAPPPVSALPVSAAVGHGPDEARLALLRKRGYRLTPLEAGEYFAEKGKVCRLGPTVIHLSLFVIIIGAILGGLTGFKHQVPVLTGQTVGAEQIYENALIKGVLAGAPAPFDVRLEKFRMTFFPSGQVRQYYSDVTILPRDGTQPYTRTMWVNEPIVHEGVYLYQSFWGVGGLSYVIDGKEGRVPMRETPIGGYISRSVSVGGKPYMFYLRSLEEPALVMSAESFKAVGQVVPHLPARLEGHTLMVKEYHFYSGFQVKRDPGIPLVYVGCGLLLLGLASMPLSHREVWIRRDAGAWVLAGRAHKGRVMLQRELEVVAGHWEAMASPPIETERGAIAS